MQFDPQLLFDLLCGDCICDSAPLDRRWPQGEGSSLCVNSYTHDCGANSSQPIHMQGLHRYGYTSSRENSPCVRARACVLQSLCLHNRGEWQSCSDQMSPSPEGSQGGEAIHKHRKQHKNPKKLVLSKGLILLCEASFHVVSDRCMYEGLL